LTIRAEPSGASTRLGLVPAGQGITVLNPIAQSSYVHIQTSDGVRGWIWAQRVEIAPAPPVVKRLFFDISRIDEEEQVIPAFNRVDWKHWIDEDGDCQNTRDEVLIRDSRVPVTFVPRNDGKMCRVAAGE
jgi:hypothetical protein